MTTLTRTGGFFGRSGDSSAGRHTGAAHAIGDQLTWVQQLCRFILSVLLAGGALAAIIALKTVAFTWHLHA
jgi:hypothetical protein